MPDRGGAGVDGPAVGSAHVSALELRARCRAGALATRARGRHVRWPSVGGPRTFLHGGSAGARSGRALAVTLLRDQRPHLRHRPRWIPRCLVSVARCRTAARRAHRPHHVPPPLLLVVDGPRSERRHDHLHQSPSVARQQRCRVAGDRQASAAVPA